MIGDSPAVVLNFNRLFLGLKRILCNWLPVLPNHSNALSYRPCVTLSKVNLQYTLLDVKTSLQSVCFEILS